jgi:potassium channel subfamily K
MRAEDVICSATTLAIICFCIHDVINITALTIFGVVHAVDDGFTYAESYWMTAAATGASVREPLRRPH